MTTLSSTRWSRTTKHTSPAAMDPFDFSAPSRLAHETCEAEPETDEWFSEPHMHLLRPAMSGPARRKVPPLSERPSNPSKAATAVSVDKAPPKKQKKDLAAVLAAHNAKFVKKTVYEPRQHRVKDVRRWEAASRKKYSELSMSERAQANTEIAAMIASGD
jgi:hypothetical protein